MVSATVNVAPTADAISTRTAFERKSHHSQKVADIIAFVRLCAPLDNSHSTIFTRNRKESTSAQHQLANKKEYEKHKIKQIK